MKNSLHKNIRAAFFSIAASVVFFSTAFSQLPPPPPDIKTAPPVAVKGANGTIANFFGIKAAHPKGMTVQMVKNGPLIPITWDKLDLVALRSDRPHIFAAYQLATQEGKVTELNMGSFEDASIKKSEKVREGYYENTISGIKFALQMPAGKPKGVLVLLLDHPRGNSIDRIPHGFDRESIYPEIREKYRYALMAFNFPGAENLAQKAVSPLVFADKKSGEATLKAIEAFAKDSGNPDMTKSPIILYGNGKNGAAFAYNFAQWKPERVVAAAASNGAFFSLAPSEASAKVPFLCIWGQYNENAERWEATNTREEIFKTHAALNPNWINAMEFRGRDSSSQINDYFVRSFLKKMIDLREPKVIEKPKEEVPEDPAKEGEEEEKKPEGPPEPKEFQFSEIPRESSYVGDMKTFKTSKIEDPAAPLEENQTWLPDSEFAKMWQKLGLGELEPK